MAILVVLVIALLCCFAIGVVVYARRRRHRHRVADSILLRPVETGEQETARSSSRRRVPLENDAGNGDYDSALADSNGARAESRTGYDSALDQSNVSRNNTSSPDLKFGDKWGLVGLEQFIVDSGKVERWP